MGILDRLEEELVGILSGIQYLAVHNMEELALREQLSLEEQVGVAEQPTGVPAPIRPQVVVSLMAVREVQENAVAAPVNFYAAVEVLEIHEGVTGFQIIVETYGVTKDMVQVVYCGWLSVET